MSSAPVDATDDGITLTDDAIREVRSAMEAESMDPEESGLRVVAREKNCDCGSVKYGLRFDPEPTEEDDVSSHDGLQVFVDPVSREHVAGVVLDYVSGPRGSGFTVEDPTATGGCGCGGHHH